MFQLTNANFKWRVKQDTIFYNSNQLWPTTNGLKYFWFWYKKKNSPNCSNFSSSPGYNIPARQPSQGIIPWRVNLPEVSYPGESIKIHQNMTPGVWYPSSQSSQGIIPHNLKFVLRKVIYFVCVNLTNTYWQHKFKDYFARLCLMDGDLCAANILLSFQASSKTSKRILASILLISTIWLTITIIIELCTWAKQKIHFHVLTLNIGWKQRQLLYEYITLSLRPSIGLCFI